MIRTIVLLLAIFGAPVKVYSESTCVVNVNTDIPEDWILKDKPNEFCVSKMHTQIKTEVEASLTYLAFASHFSKDTVNRPGFAKLFFDAASEERHHAKLLIEYLMMRGSFGKKDLLNATETKNLFIQTKNGRQLLVARDWTVTNIIRQALLLENEVTKSINGVINACEKDFNLADYMSGDFLLEQYQGMRDLAGKLSTLNKLDKSEIGLFIIDKKLLNGEVL